VDRCRRSRGHANLGYTGIEDVMALPALALHERIRLGGRDVPLDAGLLLLRDASCLGDVAFRARLPSIRAPFPSPPAF
jgi:hypothetical protein